MLDWTLWFCQCELDPVRLRYILWWSWKSAGFLPNISPSLWCLGRQYSINERTWVWGSFWAPEHTSCVTESAFLPTETHHVFSLGTLPVSSQMGCTRSRSVWKVFCKHRYSGTSSRNQSYLVATITNSLKRNWVLYQCLTNLQKINSRRGKILIVAE